ncbi:hypothetical protein ACRBEV_25680 [Methylobacterium phyllosphaerae]
MTDAETRPPGELRQKIRAMIDAIDAHLAGRGARDSFSGLDRKTLTELREMFCRKERDLIDGGE